MELGIELMYETGGATRLLTAQESMNVDNMSFVESLPVLATLFCDMAVTWTVTDRWY